MGTTEPGDRALVAAARRGDATAFEALVRRYSRAAFAIARSVLTNETDAEDACQDAWVRVLERIEDCRDPDRFSAWLFQIVRNRARNLFEYRRVRATNSLDEEHQDSLGQEEERPDRDFERSESRKRLSLAISKLPEAQREVLLLHDLAELKHRTIADSLGVTEVTSRQRLFQARAKLRDLMKAGSPRGE